MIYLWTAKQTDKMRKVKDRVVTPSVNVGVKILFGMFKLGMKLPFARRKILNHMQKISTLQEDDFKDGMFSDEMRKIVVKQIIIDMSKVAKLNKPIQDYTFYKKDVDNKLIDVSLHKIQRKNRPLILNFGSCS